MKKWFDRVERALWWAFLAALGLQTRLILWQADATFVEWRSWTLYASGLLWLALIVFALVRLERGWRLKIRMRSWDWALLVLVGAAAISIAGASNRMVGFIALDRLMFGILTYAYVRWYAIKRFDTELSLAAFVLGALAQAVLGLAQFIAQHDIGLRMLGETLLRPDMRGVAVFYDLAGDKILRAYGTLPHPNVLAILLSCAVAIMGYLYLRHGGATIRRTWLVWAAVGAPILWGLYATFSRTVIAAAAMAIAILFVALGTDKVSGGWANIKDLRKRGRQLFIAAVIVSIIFAVAAWPQVLARAGISAGEEAVKLRAYYNVQALHSGTGFLGVNWFGTGIGNFTSWLMEANPNLPTWQYQPAHNLYLLVYTETGLAGVVALVLFVVLLLRAFARAPGIQPMLRWGLFALAGMFLFVALFDHFFWTLQQGRLLWWVFWGIIAYMATQGEVLNDGS
jgi:hypothetical protein